MSKSSSSRASRKVPRKPNKPYKEFPLYPHALGYWSAKVRGKTLHFGRWGRVVAGVITPVEDQEAAWQDALRVYKARIDDAQTGGIGPGPVVEAKEQQTDGLTVKDLCNRFLTAKLRKVEAGELTSRLFAEYKEVAELCAGIFGSAKPVEKLVADDFAALRAVMAQKWGPVRLGNSITRTKTIFKFGYESGLMDRPARYGPEFVKPDKATLRKHKAKLPARMFDAHEVRALLDGAAVDGEQVPGADPVLRAMILLGVNCGFGNMDCATMTFAGLDLAGGWLDFPRPKTGIARRCPLWPETVAAIRAAAAARPKPVGYPECGRVFLTSRGNPFIAITVTKTETGAIKSSNRKDLIGIQFGKLLVALGFRREGVGFYSLRHVFETVGGGAKDQVAVDLVMGHTDPTMAGHYRERVDDARLRAVADHVRAWLWPDRAVKAEAKAG